MFGVIECMQWSGLLALGIVSYVLTFHKPSTQRNGSFSSPSESKMNVFS